MDRIVFYSWQSDLPNRTNRSFIQQALEKVAKSIRADNAVDVEPVLDRDTQGVAGSPDIAKTIFRKIASADVVVADVSLINQSPPGRPTPNPNVLLELGYALHALGDERVILVFNTAYGKLENLPFDLRMRRVMTYEMPDTAQERSTERKALEAKLDDAIRAALASIKPVSTASPLAQAIESVENLAANRVIVVRRSLSEFQARIQAKRPRPVREGATAQDLLDAITSTVDIAIDYTRLASTIATMGDEETAIALYRGFGLLLEEYDVPRGFSGQIYPDDFDFIKFIGHELFTTCFACLIREERWELISKLLAQGIPVNYSAIEQGPANSGFDEMSAPIESLDRLGQETRRLCMHADVLKARHEQQPLAALMPFDDFMAADYFLFLRGEIPNPEPQTFSAWRPWSTLFMKRSPRFIIDARYIASATGIAKSLGVSDIETLKQRLQERVDTLRSMWQPWWGQPVSQADIDKIGTV